MPAKHAKKTKQTRLTTKEKKDKEKENGEEDEDRDSDVYSSEREPEEDEQQEEEDDKMVEEVLEEEEVRKNREKAEKEKEREKAAKKAREKEKEEKEAEEEKKKKEREVKEKKAAEEEAIKRAEIVTARINEASETFRVFYNQRLAKTRAFFKDNQDNEEFDDGFLVGALYFWNKVPPYGAIRRALTVAKVPTGQYKLLQHPTVKKNVEIRVGKAEHVAKISASVRANLTRIGAFLKVQVRYKDLELRKKCVIKLSGFPSKWSPSTFIDAIEEKLPIPTEGLEQIIREKTLEDEVTNIVRLVYSIIPIDFIAWENDRTAKSFTTDKWTMAWGWINGPQEYQSSIECDECRWQHSRYIKCGFQISEEYPMTMGTEDLQKIYRHEMKFEISYEPPQGGGNKPFGSSASQNSPNYFGSQNQNGGYGPPNNGYGSASSSSSGSWRKPP